MENFEYKLNISRYGTFKAFKGDYAVESYLYTFEKDIIKLRTDDGSNRGQMRVVLTGEGDNRTLEIYDNTRYAGKYVQRSASKDAEGVEEVETVEDASLGIIYMLSIATFFL